LDYGKIYVEKRDPRKGRKVTGVPIIGWEWGERTKAGNE